MIAVPSHDKPQNRAHHNATLSNITRFGVLISAVPTEEVRF